MGDDLVSVDKELSRKEDSEGLHPDEASNYIDACLDVMDYRSKSNDCYLYLGVRIYVSLLVLLWVNRRVRRRIKKAIYVLQFLGTHSQLQFPAASILFPFFLSSFNIPQVSSQVSAESIKFENESSPRINVFLGPRPFILMLCAVILSLILFKVQRHSSKLGNWSLCVCMYSMMN